MAEEAVSIGFRDDGAMAPVGAAGRFHNGHLQSSEMLSYKVEALELAVKALESRLSNVSTGLTYQLQGVEAGADHATRRLALEVVEMGEALSRRIHAQAAAAPATEAATAPKNSTKVSPLSLALSIALVASLAALGWVMMHPSVGAGPVAPSETAAATLYAPDAPSVEALAAPTAPTHVATHRRPHASPHHVVHVRAPSGPAPAPLPDTLPGSGGHSVLGPSPG